MFTRKRQGSVVCPSCGRLVGVHDARCFNCGARNPSLFGFAPALQRLGADFGFSKLILGGCVTIYVIALLLSPGALSPRGGLFRLLSPDQKILFMFGSSGAIPVFGYGRWWTILSASWLHAGLLHIGFDMLWVRDIAPGVARLYGAGRMMLIYLIAGAGGFLTTTLMGYLGPVLPGPLHGAMNTVGASAALFGLFGALICYGQRTGQTHMSRMVWYWVAIGIVFGVVVPGIDNWAHAGGFATGWVTARVLDPLREEKPVHVLLAIIGLALTLAAVAVSVLTALPLLKG